MTALILAGHGSHLSPETAGVVWSYVDQLRAWGVADEITACFWKEAPAFHQVLDTVEADDVVVVPVFTARGFFSTSVIPAEMGLTGDVTHRSGRTIYYTHTLGEHPHTAAIVRQRIEDVVGAFGLDRSQVAVAVIGHGTDRSSASREAARQQAEMLRSSGAAAEAVAVYLDDQPDIPSLYTMTRSPVVIAVPFFLASGSHVALDVPEALGITNSSIPATFGERTVFYTPPIGTDEAACHLILELAHTTGLPFDPKPDVDPWQGFPKVGATELLAEVQARGTLDFGQLRLSLSAAEPVPPSASIITVEHPAHLRQIVRDEPFRPLATSTDLPGGWRVPIADPQWLPAVVETVYPGALADWARHRQGRFGADSLVAVASRQAGMFREIDQVSPAIQAQTTADLCGGCIRHATWYYGTSPIDAIPCKAPCNQWLCRVKEAAA